MGTLITPAGGDRTKTLTEWPCWWAADTGCYAQGTSFRLGPYLTWLQTLAPLQGRCLFATAPDVVGDWPATWARSEGVLPQLRELGYPAAIVAQDGMTELPDRRLWDVLFLGGTTTWKLSEIAYRLVVGAKALGRHVHMGRVNSLRRLRTAQLLGCDSVDGTTLRFNPPFYIHEIPRWLDRVHQQPMLPLDEATCRLPM